jgi:hypothetical protein
MLKSKVVAKHESAASYMDSAIHLVLGYSFLDEYYCSGQRQETSLMTIRDSHPMMCMAITSNRTFNFIDRAKVNHYFLISEAVEEKCKELGIAAPRTLTWQQLFSRCLKQIEYEEKTYSRKMLGEGGSQLGETEEELDQEDGEETSPAKRVKKSE